MGNCLTKARGCTMSWGFSLCFGAAEAWGCPGQGCLKGSRNWSSHWTSDTQLAQLGQGQGGFCWLAGPLLCWRSTWDTRSGAREVFMETLGCPLSLRHKEGYSTLQLMVFQAYLQEKWQYFKWQQRQNTKELLTSFTLHSWNTCEFFFLHVPILLMLKRILTVHSDLQTIYDKTVLNVVFTFMTQHSF